MKILATSDIHGNKALVYLIRRTVEKENVDALIVAGDVTPKAFYELFDTGFEYGLFTLPFAKKVDVCGAVQV